MKLKIGAKLGLGFGVVLALMLVSAVLSYQKAGLVSRLDDATMTVRVPSVTADKDLLEHLEWATNKARQAILAGANPEQRAEAKKLYEESLNSAAKDLATLTELSPKWAHQVNRDRLTAVKEEVPEHRQALDTAIEHATNASPSGIIKAGEELRVTATENMVQMRKLIEAITEDQLDQLNQDRAAIASANTSMAWTLAISTALAMALGIVVAVFLSRKISVTTASVLEQAEAIAAGDLTGDEVKVTSEDELGDLTRAINKMHASLREIIESIAQNAQNVANASEEFSAVSQQISANSEETSAQANAVSAATEQVNRGLQTVASATEEMSASIKEIAKSATEAAKVADSAMKTATETNAIVGKLGESSAEIGQVIKVITSIAQKTDLLALNATVEAARAGEVGAGFAVVANEVKELAKQTATATEDISRKIEAIQADAKSAVAAIESISGVIGQVNDISGTIATAVEEQSATSSEMSRNVSEAAKGSSEVAQNIHGVAQAAQSTSQGATDSLKAAKSLAEMSTQLRELVGRFKLETNGRGAGRSYEGKTSRARQ